MTYRQAAIDADKAVTQADANLRRAVAEGRTFDRSAAAEILIKLIARADQAQSDYRRHGDKEKTA